jgi:hypothetical protein
VLFRSPLTDDEAQILDGIYNIIKPFLRAEGISAIEEKGTSITDFENEKVTPLIGNEECAYTTKSGNIFLCGIEQAWSEGSITFQKPLSCHLFPIRIKKYSDFQAVNYEELAICSPGRKCGEHKNLYVYEFLKVPMIRALGEELYNDLCIAADELRKNNTLKK